MSDVVEPTTSAASPAAAPSAATPTPGPAGKPQEPGSAASKSRDSGRHRVQRPLISRTGGEITAARVGRASLVLAMLVAVFWTGGTEQEPVAIALGLGVVGWAMALTFRQVAPAPNPYAWMFWLLGIWSLVPLLPLPRFMVSFLHPQALTLSDSSRAALGLEPLSMLALSMAPAESAFQAALMIGGGSMAMTGGLLLSDHQGRRMSVHAGRWLAVMPLAIGGLWQLAWAPWFAPYVPLEMREQLRYVTVVNPNHVSSLLLLGLGLSFGAVVAEGTEGGQGPNQVVAALSAALLAVTPSRSGIIGLVIVAAFVLTRQPKTRPHLRVDKEKPLAQNRRARVLQTIAALGALGVIGLPALEREFGPMFILGRRDAKLIAFESAWNHLFDGFWVGQGFGSLPVKTLQHATGVDVRLEYVENMVLDLIVAHGVPMAALVIAFILYAVIMPFRRWTRYGVHAAPTIALAAVLLHDLADFSLHVAGVLFPFLMVATIADHLRPAPYHGPKGRYWTTRASTLVASGIGLCLAAALIFGAWDARNRDIGERLADLPSDKASEVVATVYPYSHHAFYRLGRSLLAEGKREAAIVALGHAIELRPKSLHARLFRLVTMLEDGGGDPTDVETLLDHPGDLQKLAIAELMKTDYGAKLAIDAAVAAPSRAWSVAVHASEHRPKTLFDLGNALRAAHKGRRFGMEYLVATRLASAGDLDQARRIGLGLLSDPTTEALGWRALASIDNRTGNHKRAFTLYADVCQRSAGEEVEACIEAVSVAPKLTERAAALAGVRSLFPFMRGNELMMRAYWLALAETSLEAGMPDEAMAAAQRAHGYDRQSTRARFLLARAALRLGNWHTAESKLEELRGAGVSESELIELSNEVSATRGPLGVQVRLSPRAPIVQTPLGTPTPRR